MAYLQLRRIAVLLAFAVVCVYAEKHASSIASMSIPEIEEKLQVIAFLFGASQAP
jgi:solute carrier family 39 (zinc transporter), member 7